MIVVPVQLSLIINCNNYCTTPVFFQSRCGLTSLIEGLILQSLLRLSTYCHNPCSFPAIQCPQAQFPARHHVWLEQATSPITNISTRLGLLRAGVPSGMGHERPGLGWIGETWQYCLVTSRCVKTGPSGV